MNQIILFIKNSFQEINPWHNIKTLHTNIREDILAGITVAIIALPMALAFGVLAFGHIAPSAGPIAGVWGAIVGGIIGGLFGGCMVGVSGPTSPKALQIAGIMLVFSQNTNMTEKQILGTAFSIIFLSGLILVIISMLKISHFIHYTPYPVIAGFMCGIGVIVILTQINAFLGLDAGKIDVNSLYVSIPSLLILLLWDLIKKKSRFLVKIPAPLITLIIGTSIAYYMTSIDLLIPNIASVAANSKKPLENIFISGTAKDFFNFYLPDLSQISVLIWPALSLAALAVLDSLLSCKVADNMTGLRHSSDRETFGQGMANMAAGLVGGVTTATATMRTVANIKFGAKTPLASIVHGLTLLVILVGLRPLVGSIPMACLAAILIKVGLDIMDYRILSIIHKISITDFLIFIVVLFVTVLFPEKLTLAVGIGIILAFFISIKQVILAWRSTSSHRIISFSDSEFFQKGNQQKELSQIPINILQPKGALFFGSMEPLINSYLATSNHEVLIIDMNHVTMVDLSGIYALEDLIKSAQSKNIKVLVFNARPHIKEVIEEICFIDHIGADNYLDSKESIISIILKDYQTGLIKGINS